MKRIVILAAVLLVTGCHNVVGPFQRRSSERVDDPLYTIAEQQRRGRAGSAAPDDQTTLAPKTYAGPNDTVGR